MSDWLAGVVSGVETRLSRFFADERVRYEALAPESVEMANAIESLTLRGGKRLRAAVLYASYRAVKDDGTFADVADACAALELLQSYLLVHDDWMDGDDSRRGGPSVHAELGSRHGDAHLGASLAILAGDLACAQSWRLLHAQTDDPAVFQVALKMHEEVIVGQQLDLMAVEDVSRMHQLKTGSYTLRGPLALGAVLGGATDAQRAALDAFGLPLGEAFQLRDDLLGTFGDPKATGKPAGNDIRAGKRTSLILSVERGGDNKALDAVRAAFGKSAAPDETIEKAIDAIEASGARRDVEARLERLHAAANAELDGADLSDEGHRMLLELATRIAVRKH